MSGDRSRERLSPGGPTGGLAGRRPAADQQDRGAGLVRHGLDRHQASVRSAPREVPPGGRSDRVGRHDVRPARRHLAGPVERHDAILEQQVQQATTAARGNEQRAGVGGTAARRHRIERGEGPGQLIRPTRDHRARRIEGQHVGAAAAIHHRAVDRAVGADDRRPGVAEGSVSDRERDRPARPDDAPTIQSDDLRRRSAQAEDRDVQRPVRPESGRRRGPLEGDRPTGQRQTVRAEHGYAGLCHCVGAEGLEIEAPGHDRPVVRHGQAIPAAGRTAGQLTAGGGEDADAAVGDVLTERGGHEERAVRADSLAAHHAWERDVQGGARRAVWAQDGDARPCLVGGKDVHGSGGTRQDGRIFGNRGRPSRADLAAGVERPERGHGALAVVVGRREGLNVGRAVRAKGDRWPVRTVWELQSARYHPAVDAQRLVLVHVQRPVRPYQDPAREARQGDRPAAGDKRRRGGLEWLGRGLFNLGEGGQRNGRVCGRDLRRRGDDGDLPIRCGGRGRRGRAGRVRRRPGMALRERPDECGREDGYDRSRHGDGPQAPIPNCRVEQPIARRGRDWWGRVHRDLFDAGTDLERRPRRLPVGAVSVRRAPGLVALHGRVPFPARCLCDRHETGQGFAEFRDGGAPNRRRAKGRRMVEMGESRTPRPRTFAGDHYERVRWFVVDRPDGHRQPAERSSHVPLRALISGYATLPEIAPPLNDASTAQGGETASTLTSLLPKQRERETGFGYCQLLRLGSFLRGLESNLGSRSPVTGPCRNHASPQSRRAPAPADCTAAGAEGKPSRRPAPGGLSPRALARCPRQARGSRRDRRPPERTWGCSSRRRA